MKEFCIDNHNLFNLVETGLIGFCARMEVKFLTTDIAYFDLSDNCRNKQQVDRLIDSGTLVLVPLEGEDFFQFTLTFRKQETTEKLTPVDFSLLQLAEKKRCRLLTSDPALVRLAEQRGIETNGFLWLTDRMMAQQLVPPAIMIEALQTLIETNGRAPRDLILEKIAQLIELKKIAEQATLDD